MSDVPSEKPDDNDGPDPARLRQVVDQLGGPVAAAKVAKIARSTLDLWLAGKSRVPFGAMTRLAQESGRSLDWLAAIEAQRNASSNRPEAIQVQASNDYSSAQLEKWEAVLKAARKDGVAAQNILIELERAGLIRLLSGRQTSIQQQSVTQNEHQETLLPNDFVAVPMLKVTASAGRGRFNAADDLGGRELVAFREEWLRSIGLTPGRTHALTAVGDSMEPTIRDGDMLLVDRSIDRVVDNGIYIVVLAGAVLVKRIQLRHNRSVVLQSDNDRYDDDTIPSDEVHDLIIEGRVRWIGRTI